jgi:glutathione S-transferase
MQKPARIAGKGEPMMKDGGLRILGRTTSINVRKVLWAADLIGIAYENEPWGLPVRDPNVPEFLGLNPNGQVPVIVDGDYVLWESNAILRYLAESRRSGLWPVDSRERGLVDQWLTWQVSELNPAWAYAHQALSRRNPAFTDPDRIAQSVKSWNKAMGLLDRHLKAIGGFAANGRVSLADIVLALSSHRWLLTEFDKPELPAVTAHHAMMQGTEAGARHMRADIP